MLCLRSYEPTIAKFGFFFFFIFVWIVFHVHVVHSLTFSCVGVSACSVGQYARAVSQLNYYRRISSSICTSACILCA